jgi:hypothetical protein
MPSTLYWPQSPSGDDPSSVDNAGLQITFPQRRVLSLHWGEDVSQRALAIETYTSQCPRDPHHWRGGLLAAQSLMYFQWPGMSARRRAPSEPYFPSALATARYVMTAQRCAR